MFIIEFSHIYDLCYQFSREHALATIELNPLLSEKAWFTEAPNGKSQCYVIIYFMTLHRCSTTVNLIKVPPPPGGKLGGSHRDTSVKIFSPQFHDSFSHEESFMIDQSQMLSGYVHLQRVGDHVPDVTDI